MKADREKPIIELALPEAGEGDPSVEVLLRAHEEKSANTRSATHGTASQMVMVGTLVEMDEVGVPLVDFPGNQLECPVPARSTISMNELAMGQEIVIVFDRGDLTRPIILGALHHESGKVSSGAHRTPAVREAIVDGERMVLSAKHEIELRCGAASLTLTAAGRVVIRGTYVLSHSAGVNRIRGGSVQIN